MATTVLKGMCTDAIERAFHLAAATCKVADENAHKVQLGGYIKYTTYAARRADAFYKACKVAVDICAGKATEPGQFICDSCDRVYEARDLVKYPLGNFCCSCVEQGGHDGCVICGEWRGPGRQKYVACAKCAG